MRIAGFGVLVALAGWSCGDSTDGSIPDMSKATCHPAPEESYATPGDSVVVGVRGTETILFLRGKNAAGSATYLRSRDLGATWTETAPVPSACGSSAGKPVAGVYRVIDRAGRLWAGFVGCVLRSDDLGDHWEKESAPMFGSLAMAPGGTLLGFDFEGGMYRSTDDGATWSAPSAAASPCDGDDMNFTTGGAWLRSSAPGTLCRSGDSGAGWTKVRDECMSVRTGPAGTVLCTGEQLLSLDDGRTFKSLDASMLAGPFGAIDSGGGVWLAAMDDKSYYVTRDRGLNWTTYTLPVGLGSPAYVRGLRALPGGRMIIQAKTALCVIGG